MLARKSARICQLSGGDLPPAPQLARIDLQPRFRINNITKHDRALAESFLRREASATRGSEPLLRRVKSRLARPDKVVTLRVLCNLVYNNGPAEIAQIFLDRLYRDAQQSTRPFDLPDALLFTAVRNCNLKLVRLLAPFTAEEAVTSVLESAVAGKDLRIIIALLEHGADVNTLNHRSLFQIATTDLKLLHIILRAPNPLDPGTYGDLCSAVIQHGHPSALDVLLQSISDYQSFRGAATPWNRDILLRTTISSPDKTYFFKIAVATSAWPLRDYRMFLYVLNTPGIDRCLAKDMVEVLLCLSDVESPAFHASLDIQSALCHCLQQQRDDIFRLMMSYGARASAEPIILACQNEDTASLHLLLQGRILGADRVAARISTLQNPAHQQMRRQVLSGLLADGAAGSWKHEELVKAAQDGEVEWVESLITANASVEYDNGAALLAAVSMGHVAVVQKLLLCPVSLKNLQAAFPGLSQLDPLPRRLLVKLFLQQGLAGPCLDDALNHELCNYSDNRDVELIEILVKAGGHCNSASLEIALERADVDIFDHLRQWRTLLHEAVWTWFKSWHFDLFNHVTLKDERTAVSSACLKMLLSKLGAIQDLCDAHNADRQFECFHSFLERRTNDINLFHACLNWTQRMGFISFSELVLTAVFFSDLDLVTLLVKARSRPSLGPRSSSAFASSARDFEAPNRPTDLSNIRLPPLGQDISVFCDKTRAEAMAVACQHHLEGHCVGVLLLRLLERHLHECKQSHPAGAHWPSLTIDFLLSQPIALARPEFLSCLQMAVASRQWPLFEILLDRPLPRLMLSSFFLVDEASSLSTTALQILLDSQAISVMKDAFFADEVQRAFNLACLAQDQQLAILLSTRSRCKLRITDVLNSVQQAIDVSEVEYLANLLATTTSSREDFEVLWQHVCQRDLQEKDFPILEILLKAGGDGDIVVETLMDAVEKGNRKILVLILSNWQTPRLAQYRKEFNYHERRPISPLPQELPETEIFSVLGRALATAVRSDQADLCVILCAHGAPLICQNQSLVELAVEVGSRNVLRELLRATSASPDTAQAVDFALLHAVLHGRLTWVPELIELGASVGAYDSEILRAAARLPKLDTLTLFLSHIPSSDGCHAVQQVLVDRLGEAEVDLDTLCAVFQQVYEAGFEQETAFSEALLVLSGLQATDFAHATIMIQCGASVDFRDGACMIQMWRKGNIYLFPDLVSHSSSQSTVSRLLNVATTDYLQTENGGAFLSTERALVVFRALLEAEISQEERDSSFDAIVRARGTDEVSLPIIQMLLERGARFCDGAGLPYYQLCRSDSPDIQSLIVKSNPSLRTRLSGLQHLFRHQDEGLHVEGTAPSTSISPRDHKCLYNIDFPVSSDECTELESSDIVNLLGSMLHPRGQPVTTTLMFSYFFMRGGLELLESRSSSDDDRNEVEQMLIAAITVTEETGLEERIEFIVRVMQIDALDVAKIGSTSTGLTLGQGSLNRLLLLSLHFTRFALARTLLEAGADPNAIGEDGQSALYLATEENEIDLMERLIDGGAKENDCSLHIATCLQFHEAMHLLLQAGHSPSHTAGQLLGRTPLEAFVRFDHLTEAEDLFGVTLAVLLCDTEIPDSFWKSDPSPLSLALFGSCPYAMASAMLDILPEEIVELPLVPRDSFMLSILSLVERDENLFLTEESRTELADRLQQLGFQRTYYTIEGDQPEDAINVPEEYQATEIRERRRAFKDKDCAVCGDKPEQMDDITAGLTPSCSAKHSWADDIICADCLRGHLESQMFPQANDRFPSSKVKCWAPNCAETLAHSIIQLHASPARFAVYDDSLTQLCLQDGTNTIKCARPGCTGAAWVDEEEDRDVTIARCPVCESDTCIQCNQLYDMHREEPCPQGEEARGAERRREEEAATARLMATGKKCPKCQLPYERIEGCDHIVCGKDAHSQGRSRELFPPFLSFLFLSHVLLFSHLKTPPFSIRFLFPSSLLFRPQVPNVHLLTLLASLCALGGCGFEFCYMCGADYDAIRRLGNAEHVRGCSHYA